MSVNGLTGGQSSTVAGFFATASRDVFAGLVTSIMSIAYGLSFAALIFAPPLTPWIAYGIAATFLTSAVSAASATASCISTRVAPGCSTQPRRNTQVLSARWCANAQ